MDNQHKEIKGYRNLKPVEVELMNEGKELEALCNQYIDKVRDHLSEQMRAAIERKNNNEPTEVERIETANPHRCLAIGATHFETGLMFVIKAVAQPIKQ